MRRSESKRGFTLVELMAVVIIIGILAAIVIPHFAERVAVARKNTTKAQIRIIEGALAQYKFDSGAYPTTAEGLSALVTRSGGYKGSWPKGGYLPKLPKDGWSNDFVYTCPGKGDAPYEIISYGADGKEGGEDDNADISSSD